MNIKRLIATSFVAFASTSAADAADVLVPSQEVSAPVFSSSPASFSWTGFYLGAQIGNFSSDVKMVYPPFSGKNEVKEGETPKPSGFMGGAYAGFNFDLGNNVVFGIETDAVWVDKKAETKFEKKLDQNGVHDFNNLVENPERESNPTNIVAVGDNRIDHFTYAEKWSGATRVRLGFVVGETLFPYVSGGMAYADMNTTVKVESVKPRTLRTVRAGDEEASSSASQSAGAKEVFNKNTMMKGYTLGAGVDYAMTDNVILRAEYRYSDFGKMKLEDATFKADFNKYKTNDFRLGVSYKF